MRSTTTSVHGRASVCSTLLREACAVQTSARSSPDTGFFSSDRTIQQYADDIWDAKPVPLRTGTPVHESTDE